MIRPSLFFAAGHLTNIHIALGIHHYPFRRRAANKAHDCAIVGATA